MIAAVFRIALCKFFMIRTFEISGKRFKVTRLSRLAGSMADTWSKKTISSQVLHQVRTKEGVVHEHPNRV
jgi:hypothetical protein